MDGWIAIVMAGGKGTRMRSSLPKVLHPVAGLPMVAHTMRAVRELGASRVLLVTNRDAHDPMTSLAGDDVVCVAQPEALGTGDALALALANLPSDTQNVLLLNAEKPLLRAATLTALADLHAKRGAVVTVLTLDLPTAEAEHLGTIQRGATRKPVAILEAGERPSLRTASAETNVGVYALDALWARDAVGRLQPHASGELFVTDLVAMAVADGRRADALPLTDRDEGLSVKTRSNLAQVELAMQRRLRDAAMDAGATLMDPATTYFDIDVTVSPDVVLHPNTALRGTTTVAEGAVIGPNAQVVDSQVGPDVVVRSAVVEGAVLERGASVGPYSHLRAGSVLMEGAFIGSHAEIKASRIGRGAHVGHFSYVGDALIGDRANIGAGTVTCNFDGTSKHVTEIGEGAFIGSDSLLVAPVRVGANAVTGAGAVVNRDVADGERVAGVPARPLDPMKRRTATGASGEGGRSLG